MEENDPRKDIKVLLKENRLKELLEEAAKLHGHYCGGLAFGVKAGYEGLKRLGFDNTGMEELIAVVECNNCFVDGIQVSTGCSLGNNALVYKGLPQNLWVEKDGRIAISPSGRSSIGVRPPQPGKWLSRERVKI